MGAPPFGFTDEGSMRTRAHVGIGMTCQQRIERDRSEALIGLDSRELAPGPVLPEACVAGLHDEGAEEFADAQIARDAVGFELRGDASRHAKLEGNEMIHKQAPSCRESGSALRSVVFYVCSDPPSTHRHRQ